MELNETVEAVDLIKDDSKLLEIALKRFDLAYSAWNPIYTKVVDDIKFANGNQWDESNKAKRTSKNRSSLTFNMIRDLSDYIVNNAISNQPNIKIHPVGDGANKNTAKLLDGLIKTIQYKSNADSAYINALTLAVQGGVGWYRVLPKEKYNKTCLTIEKIKDPTSILVDPEAEMDDFSDAEYLFVVKNLPKEDFEERFPDKTSKSMNSSSKQWYSIDSVRICEYWVLGADGYWDQYVISGEDILEANTNYMGIHLPFCFVAGKEVYIDGTRDFYGITRDLRDPQKLLNYTKSETADYLARGTKAQWLVEAAQIQGEYQRIWDHQNMDQLNYLPYNRGTNGTAPQRIDPPTPPTGLIQASVDCMNDIRTIAGIRDPMKDIPQSQSGKAINLQIQQGNIGILRFINNLNKSIKRCGEILIDLIPYYYSEPQVLEILGLDGNITTAPVNQAYEDNGEIVEHNLTVGEYGCIVSTGPNYQSQKEEALDKLLEMSQRNPQIAQIGGDIIIKQMDFQGADELADRLRATIPPQVLAASNQSNQDKGVQLQALQNQLAQQMQQSQQMQQQMEQMNQALIQAQQMANDKSSEIQLKQFEVQSKLQMQQMELEMKQQLAIREMELKYRINKENIESKESIESMNAEVDVQIKEMDILSSSNAIM